MEALIALVKAQAAQQNLLMQQVQAMLKGQGRKDDGGEDPVTPLTEPLVTPSTEPLVTPVGRRSPRKAVTPKSENIRKK
jgi:hypothetical protein